MSFDGKKYNPILLYSFNKLLGFWKYSFKAKILVIKRGIKQDMVWNSKGEQWINLNIELALNNWFLAYKIMVAEMIFNVSPTSKSFNFH